MVLNLQRCFEELENMLTTQMKMDEIIRNNFWIYLFRFIFNILWVIFYVIFNFVVTSTVSSLLSSDCRPVVSMLKHLLPAKFLFCCPALEAGRCLSLKFCSVSSSAHISVWWPPTIDLLLLHFSLLLSVYRNREIFCLFWLFCLKLG